MKILIVGDTHGQQAWVSRYYRSLSRIGIVPDIALQLGDWGFFPKGCDWPKFVSGEYKFPLPTYIVHGNHEDIKEATPYITGKSKIDNLYVFPRYGDIVDVKINDEIITIFGVGGANNAPGDNSLSYPFETKIEYMKAHALWEKRGKPKIDLLITHEAPSGVGVPGDPWRHTDGKSHLDCGDAGLRYLFKTVAPVIAQLNGHYHRQHRYEEDGLVHMTLPTAPQGAVLLDTLDGTFNYFTSESLDRIYYSMERGLF